MTRSWAETLGAFGGNVAAFWLLVLLFRLGARPDGLGIVLLGALFALLGMSAGATVWDRRHPSGGGTGC